MPDLLDTDSPDTDSAADDELRLIFETSRPLIDVRAPVEFERGAFPGAVNLPILVDEEREQVGTCYKEQGPAAATALGHELVSGPVKQQRLEAWQSFLKHHPEALIYCFRGGQRSRIACEWLAAEGLDAPRIAGGYKRMRQFLLSVFEALPRLVIVSGQTGTGKTGFIQGFLNSVDLEGIANHRGSAFGRHITPQPCQVSFENAVAIEFLKLRDLPDVLLEDESRLIGRLNLPLPLQEKMRASPVIVIEEPLEARADRIFNEYIDQQWQEYIDHFGEGAQAAFQDYLLTAVDAIRKRLGNVGHGHIRGMMMEAINEHRLTGSMEGHRRWITLLLADYYDPMYNYQLERKAPRVRIQGPADVVAEWYREHQGTLV